VNERRNPTRILFKVFFEGMTAVRSGPSYWDRPVRFFAGIQLKRGIHEEQLLPYCLLMFEKEIILEEQLAARSLLQ
jgi:hypothetical protein